MAQALSEILVILFLLACITIGVAGLTELAACFGWRRSLGRGFWVSLVGDTLIVFGLLVPRLTMRQHPPLCCLCHVAYLADNRAGLFTQAEVQAVQEDRECGLPQRRALLGVGGDGLMGDHRGQSSKEERR
jgi:hypothetical protein